MNYQSQSDLILKYEDNSLWITLDNPKMSNAYTDIMISYLVETLERADEDNTIRCIIITGTGKHFCAGGDVKAMQTQTGMFAGNPNELRERYKRGIQKIPLCFERLSTPVIAMINGAAIGAGLDLACMCDIRIANDKAKFGETFVKLGLIPGDGGTYFLQRVVGFSKAMELTLTGDVINSSTALDIGLINYEVGADSLLSTTQNIVKKIINNAPIAVQMAKRSMLSAYRSDLQTSLDMLSAFQGIGQRTDDHFLAVQNIFNESQTDFSHK
jgi:enoyl-CoA hydratase/carnithine racemase